LLRRRSIASAANALLLLRDTDGGRPHDVGRADAGLTEKELKRLAKQRSVRNVTDD
jgi:hypothetical protein